MDHGDAEKSFCFIIKYNNKGLEYRRKTCDGKRNMNWCIVAIQFGMDES